ncbi:MAG: hypothetical protein PBU97_13385 [Stenotrophomonas maltophilia]
MTSQTILEIQAALTAVEQNIDAIDLSKFRGQNFGEEQEFTAKSLITGARALASDIRGQVEKPERFLKVTIPSERRAIASNLNVLTTALIEEQLQSIATVLQELKIILRPFNLRSSSETRQQLERAVDELHRQVAAIKEERKTISDDQQKILELSSEISKRLNDSSERLGAIDEARAAMADLVTASQANANEIERLKQTAASASIAAEEYKGSSENSRDLIDEFFKKIATRESQLLDQEVKTATFTTTMEQHQLSMDAIEAEANRIIESARTALSYKTAEGISAAFIERYNETKADSLRSKWIIAAGILVAAAIALGVWITWDTSVTVAVVAGRVSLIPILIAGAWFCAHQYVKLSNISEEYAYKSVLSKSIVGFSEQMSRDNDAESDHSHYIRTVLAEIHTNPLRPQGKSSHAPSDKLSDIEGAEKLLRFVTEMQKIARQT